MECLSCGWCCNTMSPITHGKCPNVVEPKAGFFLCKDYDNRPVECHNHSFPGRVCPLGSNVLNLNTTLEVEQRIDDVWELIKEGSMATKPFLDISLDEAQHFLDLFYSTYPGVAEWKMRVECFAEKTVTIKKGDSITITEPMDSVKRRLKQDGMTDVEVEEYIAALVANTAQKGMQTDGG